MKLIALFLMLLPVFAKAQTDDIPQVNGEYVYTGTVNLDNSYSKEMLYANAKRYFAETYKDVKDVILTDNAAEGKVVGKGHFEFKKKEDDITNTIIHTYKVDFATEIICSNGTYSYKLSDIKIKAEYSSGGSFGSKLLTVDDVKKHLPRGPSKQLFKKVYAELNKSFNTTVDGLKASMAKK